MTPASADVHTDPGVRRCPRPCCTCRVPRRIHRGSQRTGSTAGAWRGRYSCSLITLEGAEPVDGVTFLDCDVAEAVRIGLDAADGKNLEIFSPSIGTPLLERGLIDEVDLRVLPRLLGDGTRRYDVAAGPCASCRTWVGDDPNAATNLVSALPNEN